MQNSSFNFASVFAIMVLLVFSYITFLGLTYWQKGNLLLPIILTVALIAIVATCVLFMCKAKATRWKRLGIIGQTFFGLIILIVFALASIPFTNFMDVINNSEEIQGKISNTCEAAESLDKAYAEYVKARIDTYKVTLTTISMSKKHNLHDIMNIWVGQQEIPTMKNRKSCEKPPLKTSARCNRENSQ